IRGLDGVRRHIAVSAFPLIGQGDRFLGVISVFWEVGEERWTAARAAGRAMGLEPAAAVALAGGSPPDRGHVPQAGTRPSARGAAVSQQEIEVILTRQLATYLAVPVFIVDPEGTLLFY